MIEERPRDECKPRRIGLRERYLKGDGRSRRLHLDARQSRALVTVRLHGDRECHAIREPTERECAVLGLERAARFTEPRVERTKHVPGSKFRRESEAHPKLLDGLARGGVDHSPAEYPHRFQLDRDNLIPVEGEGNVFARGVPFGRDPAAYCPRPGNRGGIGPARPLAPIGTLEKDRCDY